MDGGDNDSDGVKDARCFVCDDEIQGRYYALATCKTQHSQTKIIQKLGELVGERYMFVIAEDDVICRCCATLINTFDRLEMEMRNIRDRVLQFIKLKYALTDGDLQDSNNRPKPCQPPQITRSNVKEISYCAEQSEIDLETYSKNKKIQKKPYSWLQCDKCKYTTESNSFMMYHLRDHLKQKFCNKCGMRISANKKDKRHNCTKINELENKENEKDNSNIIVKNDSMEPSFLETAMQSILLPVQMTPPPLTGLSSCDHLYISNVTPNASTSSNLEINVLEQDMDIVDTNDLNKMTRSESNIIQETEIQTRREDKRQTLTLTEDGNVEIVEMESWNNM
ncbi:uncharacterized protein [Linepithema humile]|uniref:uncharacterized protein n=1 Tax=Linepithema humile TaxID=83485 RepID=UPI00351E659E